MTKPTYDDESGGQFNVRGTPRKKALAKLARNALVGVQQCDCGVMHRTLGSFASALLGCCL